MSFEKELLGFYVTGHPLDAYAPMFRGGRYQTILSLGEVNDRANFRVAGAIAQIERKFTKKEGKPFAVLILEDLTGTLEVVLWNETYVPIASALEIGVVLAVRGTVDKRDDSVRATAQKAHVLTTDSVARYLERNGDGEGDSLTNGNGDQAPRVREEASLTLRFGAGSNAEDLRTVREILASSPGSQPVTLMLTGFDGETVQIETGEGCRIDLTPVIEERLARWL